MLQIESVGLSSRVLEANCYLADVSTAPTWGVRCSLVVRRSNLLFKTFDKTTYALFAAAILRLTSSR